jgi:uncharacterized protein (DUF58 family)
LRCVDWNAYARLDEILVRQFRAEREAPLHLILDASASMGTPEADGKFSFAVALATCLAYISLHRHDPVRIVTTRGDHCPPLSSPLIGHPKRFAELADFLDQLQPAGSATLDQIVEGYVRSSRTPGLAIVLSDFMMPSASYERALESLDVMGCSVAAIRVLGPRERDPSFLPSHARLHDVETGLERVVYLTEQHRTAYAKALTAHLDEMAAWCTVRSMPCPVLDPTDGVEKCLFRDLPSAGLVR